MENRGPAPKIKLVNFKNKSSHRKIDDSKTVITPDKIDSVEPPPSYLTASAKKHWKQVLPVLQKNGVITEMDMFMFEQLCSSYGDIHELRNEIKKSKTKDGKKSGVVAYLDGKNSQTTPLHTALVKAQAQYEKFSDKFGMSPTARQRLKIEKPKDKSEFEKFLEVDETEPDEVLA